MKEFMSIKDACDTAHVSRWTVHRWISRGAVRAVRDGKDKSNPIRIDAVSLIFMMVAVMK